VDPIALDCSEHLDFFGNRVSYFSIEEPHLALTVTATSEVELVSESDSFLVSGMPWELVREQLRLGSHPDILTARQFVLDSGLVKASETLADYAAPSFPAGRPLVEAVTDFMRRIHDDFNFDPGFTTVTTPVPEVLEHRRGVCQDFAQLAIGGLRSLGLAARYVSGYLETLPPPGQEKLRGSDASHAWASVYVPDMGWLDFDPTNNVFPAQRHITTAWGRDYSDVTPLKGVLIAESPQHQLSVSVDVEGVG
jgi:transglutaminase-like putative cysteine protease